MSEGIIGLSLLSLRRALCEAQIDLRRLEHLEKACRAWAEDRVIVAAGGAGKLGSNETERQRTLTLGLDGDSAWQLFRGQLECQQVAVMRLQTELDIRLDGRIDAQIAVRDRLARALEHQNISISLDTDPEEALEGFDAVQDEIAVQQSFAALPDAAHCIRH
ncbi:MAG: hypothetical protein V2A73_02965 [Pseudomonadota bacterium]